MSVLASANENVLVQSTPTIYSVFSVPLNLFPQHSRHCLFILYWVLVPVIPVSDWWYWHANVFAQRVPSIVLVVEASLL